MASAIDIPLDFLHHPEIRVLFQYDFRIRENTLRDLLRLPRKSLVADLEAILRQAPAWFDQFAHTRQTQETQLPANRCFVVHAFSLLGELGATESLPAMADFLALDQAQLDLWLGAYLKESLWEVMYFLTRDDYNLLTAVARDGNYCNSVRAVAVSCMCQMTWHQLGRRLEILPWLQYLADDIDKGEADVNPLFLGHLVRELKDLRATDFLPQIRQWYTDNLLRQDIAGSLKDVEREMKSTLKSWVRRPLHDLFERYTELCLRLDPFGEERDESKLVIDQVAPPRPGKGGLRTMGRKKQPFQRGQKVGRNATCPCGSGKKYKKCCG